MSLEANPSKVKIDPGPGTSKNIGKPSFKDDTECENIDCFKVELGNILIDRYQAIEELGRGKFSIVWLFWDYVGMKFVAIKITNKSYIHEADKEIEMLRRIHYYDENLDKTKKKIIDITNNFEVDDKTGIHKCIVYDEIGKDLYDIMITYYRQGFPKKYVKSIIRQVLEALCYLHIKCGIIHTDVKPENVLICLRNNHIRKKAEEATYTYLLNKKFNSSTESLTDSNSEESILTQEAATNFEGLSKKATEGEQKTLKKTHSKTNEKKVSSKEFKYSCQGVDSPKQTFNYLPWKDKVQCPEEELRYPWGDDMDIRLADFNCSRNVKYHNAGTIQTRSYRAPEVLIGAEYYTSVDIWSTACLAYELATGDVLFEIPEEIENFIDEFHLGIIMNILGNIPKTVRSLGKLSNIFFDDKGNLKNTKALESTTIEDKLIKVYHWSVNDAKEFANFLEIMLCYDPHARASAAECLRHPWLKN